MSGLLAGKTAVVAGIANKWSLAYGIAESFAREGASLVLTYLNEKQRDMIASITGDMPVAKLLPCDVTKDEEIAALTGTLCVSWVADRRAGAQPGVCQSRRSEPPVRRDPARRIPAGAERERVFVGGDGARGGSR